MANVRIAQMGQTAVNRPFYEVVTNGKRYVTFVNAANRIEVGSPRFLQNLGVNSLIANQFQESADADLIIALGLTGNRTTVYDSRFPTITLGTGLGFIADYKPYSGWATLQPSTALYI